MVADRPADIARTARLIARGAGAGALATQRRAARAERQGHPYVSKVGVAWDVDGAPIFLFSTLAAHTQDVLADGRASLLLEAPSTTANPLESARCTLVGQAHKITDEQEIAHARARYLAHHPGAALYAGFGDFAFWRLHIDKVHYVGGFGAAKWLKAVDYLAPAKDLAQAEERLIADLSGPRCDDLAVLIKVHLGCGARGWKPVGVDADGVSLSGPKGRHARVDFLSPAADLSGWRRRFQALVKKARA